MHVLLLAPSGAIHSYRLTHALLEAGHRVTLLSTNDPIEGHSSKYRFIQYPGIRGFHRLSAGVRAKFEPSIRAAQFRHIWRSVRPDVVNVQGIDMRATYCAYARVRPLALTAWGADINDLFEEDGRDEGYQERLASLLGTHYYITDDKLAALSRYRRFISAALNGSDLVSAVTPQILRRCEGLASRKLKTHLFRYGVDFDLFRPGYILEAQALRKKLGIPQDAKVLLSVRTLQPLFGHDYIIKAFAEVAKDPSTPKSVLVFQEKYSFKIEIEKLKAQVEELGLAERVFYLPTYIPPLELPVQYALADVVLNYPVQDGFPVSLLEAAACKRPVVTSDLAAYEGTYGDSMLRVPPRDEKALARAIKKSLTEGKDEQRERVELAYNVAREVGDQRRNFEKLFRLFETLANGVRSTSLSQEAGN